MKPLVLLAVVAVAMSLVACGGPPKTDDTDIVVLQYDDLLELMANPNRPRNSGLLDAFKKKGEGRTLLVDVRKPEKYQEGHIPGAVNIPLPELEASAPQLGEATAIVVYAGGWTDYLSPAGAKKLLALGYKNVYEFRGGMELWQAEGGRVETGE